MPTLTEEVCACGLEANGIAGVPSRATKGKRKSFLNIGKRPGFRRSSEIQNLVSVVHLEKLDALSPVLSEVPEHQAWTRSSGEAKSKRTKVAR